MHVAIGTEIVLRSGLQPNPALAHDLVQASMQRSGRARPLIVTDSSLMGLQLCSMPMEGLQKTDATMGDKAASARQVTAAVAGTVFEFASCVKGMQQRGAQAAALCA